MVLLLVDQLGPQQGVHQESIGVILTNSAPKYIGDQEARHAHVVEQRQPAHDDVGVRSYSAPTNIASAFDARLQ
jgi:hypothetical protein